MRKRIVTLISILAVIVCSLCFTVMPVMAQSSNLNITTQKVDVNYIAATLEDFVTKHKDRTHGTLAEEEAANYLAEKFLELGLEPYYETQQEVTSLSYKRRFEYTVDNSSKVSHNVVGQIKGANNTLKTVYIGAHYDNYYGITDSNGDTIKSNGAFDNGTGVATMLAIAKAMESYKGTLDFNVVFIAFGAEEIGIVGSGSFVDGLSREQIDNSVMMFNLDSIGAGDNLYLYTDEVSSIHHDYIIEVGDKNGVEVSNPPANKYVQHGYSVFKDIPYVHFGMLGDNARFHNKGIPSAMLFSFNWEKSQGGFVQSVNKTTMYHKSTDTLEILKTDYANYASDCAGVGSIVLNSVVASGFSELVAQSLAQKQDYSFWTNKWYTIAVSGGILLIAVGIVVWMFYYNKNKGIKKGEHLRTPNRNIPPRPSVTSASAESIFGFGKDENKKDNNDDTPTSSGTGGGSIFGDEFD